MISILLKYSFTLVLLFSTHLLAAQSQLQIKDYITNHPDNRYIYESFIYTEDEFDDPGRDSQLVFCTRNDGHQDQNPHFSGSFVIENSGSEPASFEAVLYFQQITRDGIPIPGRENIELWRGRFTSAAHITFRIPFEFRLDKLSRASNSLATALLKDNDSYKTYYRIVIHLEQPGNPLPLCQFICDNQSFLFTLHVSSPPPEW